MSLETLLEAARYVEQQELRQQQQQLVAFRVMSPSLVPAQQLSTLTAVHNALPSTNMVPASSPMVPAVPVVPQLSHPTANVVPVSSGVAVQLARSPVNNNNNIGSIVISERLPQVPLQRPTQLVLTQQPSVQSQPVNDLLKPQPMIVQQQPLTTISNGFEKSLPQLIVDENQQDLKKRHVPSVIKSGTREVHNKLEKNRRAHLKECFELLKKQLPPQQDEKKSSNLSILHSALRYIQVLKKKERENEHEMERLAREKIAAQQRLAALKKEFGAQWDNIDFNALVSEQNATIATTSTVTIKEERTSDTEDGRIVNPTSLQPTQLSVHLPIPQVGYPVSQGLVVGLHKVALVSKSLPLVTSPLTHIITTPPQLNGKVVPLVNAQYLMKPVVVVSTASAGGTTISPRPS